MHIGQYNVGKTHTGKSNDGKSLGFKTFIRPSKKSQQKQHKAIQNIVRRNRTIEQERLIEQLNPVIRG
jgi:RNA-directed DNA polymerase